MGTDIRPEVKPTNKYYISKHRYYELKHYCMQYSEWQDAYERIQNCLLTANDKLPKVDYSDKPDPTAKLAERLVELDTKMRRIRRLCQEADVFLADYILESVTQDKGYTCLSTKYDLACSKDTFFDRYRKFFWLLSKERD